MLEDKKSKRFIIFYKKYINQELTKQIKVITEKSEKEAIKKISQSENINPLKIDRDERREGWVYCNEIYNPQIEDTISNTIDNDT